MSILLAFSVVDRGNSDEALVHAQRGVQMAREAYATDPEAVYDLTRGLRLQAHILDSLGRLDEAIALDAELMAVSPEENDRSSEAPVRRAIKHMAAGEDVEAEELLRPIVSALCTEWPKVYTRQMVETVARPHVVLAELLERRGTEEALAEARTLRDEVAQQLAGYEARRAAAFEETRAATAEAVRQWRRERNKAVQPKKGGKGKKRGKKKGEKGKAKGKGASSAAAIEWEAPREPPGEEAAGAAVVEGAAAAEAQQQAPEGESQPPVEEEEEAASEECAICLQDLELEDDEGEEGEALVVLVCGHRFHEICGDMWCAKCADKGWGVTCPRCRAPYVVAER
jgi:hypothetical protein